MPEPAVIETTGARRARAWFAIALGTLLITLVAGLLVPVYSDETGWRFQERAGIDGFDILFSDLCGPNTIATAPWHMMTVRWFSAAANLTFASPFFIRLEGVLCALAWLVMVGLLLLRLEPARERRLQLGTIAAGLLSLGTLPFLLVLSRPEQPLILTTALILLVTFWRPPSHTITPFSALAKIAPIVILTVIAQSYHMKGVLYAVIACTAILVCAQGPRTLLPRALGLAAVITVMLASAHYWTARLACPGNAAIAAMYAHENVASALAEGKGLGNAVQTLLAGASPLNYVALTVPTGAPMSSWLPPGHVPTLVTVVYRLGLPLCWGAAIVAALLSLTMHIRANGLRSLFEPRPLLALALLGCVAIWGASQLNRNVYEAGHVLPALVLATLLALTLPRAARGRWMARATVGVTIIGAASQLFLLAAFVPPLAAAAHTPGYVSGQPYSASIADYAPVRQDIHSAMVAAGIPQGRTLNRVMVDEVTYLALQDTRLPIHRLGVLSVWNGGLADPVGYLLSRGSDGIVIGCHLLPARLRQAAARSGPICALSAKTLDRLRGAP
ncbi:hypothetical protein [Novosphingobium cyanobacteriorum]|uniref:Glycosyltransferase RgtA/B/C/D-like domain-containing protein n=1 Tax=Novosphingobium cyanobacteriorum TaxID=3024215 RepID=A0ABT6CCU5_9SPHN|nr:hypothetical protein [Novosphingobium cyanobacteriorum]MDF8331636.1 hypothetical protein [Novosphingobium cyanobacteriorum]